MRIFKNGCPSSHQHQCTFQMFFCTAPLLNAQCSRRRAHTLCINATTRAAISHFLRLIVVVVVIFCRRLYELEEFLANYHAQTKQSNTTVYGIANKCHHKLHVIFFFFVVLLKMVHTHVFTMFLWSKRDRVE